MQTASLIQHLVSPAASTKLLHPIGWQEASKLLVFAHVRSSIPTACAAWHLTLSLWLAGHELQLSAPSQLKDCSCSAPLTFAPQCRSLHRWPTELHHFSVNFRYDSFSTLAMSTLLSTSVLNSSQKEFHCVYWSLNEGRVSLGRSVVKLPIDGAAAPLVLGGCISLILA